MGRYKTVADETGTVPPDEPPPLLTRAQIEEICERGHLGVELPPSLEAQFSALFSLAATFFRQDDSIKASQYPSTHGTELGFYRVAEEKQYLTLRYAVGSNEELESQVAQLWQQTAIFLARILSDISRALGIPLSAWSPIVDDCLELPDELSSSLPTLMRLFQYEPQTGIAEKHCDMGLLTLCVGTGKGLQVWRNSKGDEPGAWCDAEGPTVLIGSALAILSRGRLAQGLHRVIGNPDGRSSIVYALRPSIRHEIDLTDFGARGTLSLERLWNEIKGSRLNVNANKDIREKQRAELASRYGKTQETSNS